MSAKDDRYNHSPKGRARYERYADSGHKAAQDAAWYADGGWYRQTKSKLLLHLDETQRRLEDCLSEA